MINGFETITYELTDAEYKLVSGFVKAIKNHNCENCAITSKSIIEGYAKKGIKLTGSRVRKIIAYIRTQKLVQNLISSKKGYWIENDKERVREYVNSLEARANSIITVVNSFNI